jgi:hypothetical protein
MAEPEDKTCPHCGESLKPEAILCRFCQRGISRVHFKPCTACGEMIRLEAILCRFCKTGLDEHFQLEGERQHSSDVRQPKPAPLPWHDQSIYEMLIANGLITPEEWEQVQLERQRTSEPVSLILSRLNLASTVHLKNALELQYGVNYISLRNSDVSAQCARILPKSCVLETHSIPIRWERDRLVVAMVNPNDLLVLDEIKSRMKGCIIERVVCTLEDFADFMTKRYDALVSASSED